MAHAEGGVKTGRQADPSYKRPEAEQQQPEQRSSEPPAASAGFSGESTR